MKIITSFLLVALFAASAYAAAVGDACTAENGVCDAATMECGTDLKCQCKVGFVVEETSCRAILGGPCTPAGSECAVVAEAECVDTTCQCKGGFVASGDLSQCLRIIIGETCDAAASDVCFNAPNAECVGTTCACKGGFVASADLTACLSILGGACSAEGTECIAVTNSECLNEKCTCKSGFITSTDSSKCLEVVTELGGACEDVVQCESFGNGNSTCAENTASPPVKVCQCLATFHAASDGACYQTVALGGACGIGYECQNMENPDFYDCNINVCGCSAGHRFDVDKCIQTAVGDPCTEATNECDAVTMVCNAGQCACDAGFIVDGTLCRSILGGACTPPTGTECDAVDNAECITNAENENVCACEGGFTASGDSSKCLTIVNEVGGACEEEVQCDSLGVDNSTCALNTANPAVTVCLCATSYHELDKECFKTVGLNEACTDDAECRSLENPSFYECSSSKCACSQGHKIDTTQNICINSAGKTGVTLAAILSALFVVFSRFNSV